MTLYLIPVKDSSYYCYFFETPAGAIWLTNIITNFERILSKLETFKAIDDLDVATHCEGYKNELDIAATIIIDTNEISTLPQLQTHHPELFI